MSFEGYEIHVCCNGHLDHQPYSYGECGPAPCYCCGAASAFCYVVDTTNDGGIAPDLQTFTPELPANDRLYSIPSNQSLRFCLTPESHVLPVAPVKFRDLDHPQDGPFATEQAAWDNKAKYWRAVVDNFPTVKRRRRRS